MLIHAITLLYLINDPITTKRLIIIDNGNVYRRATQWEYVKFENIHFPSSDNSKFLAIY